jgi:hypothetical protein
MHPHVRFEPEEQPADFGLEILNRAAVSVATALLLCD